MKLIATDLDGTLLNEKGEVSRKNAEAIERAINQGLKFVVATGRSYGAAEKPLKEAGLTAPVICLNGAQTYSEDKTVLRSAPLGRTTAKHIQELCDRAGMYFEFFTSNGVYSTNREHFLEVMIDIMKSANPSLSEEEIIEGAEQRFQDEQVEFIQDNEEVFAIEGLEIYKILAFSLHKEKLADLRQALQGKEDLAITSSGDINLEFNHPDAQKGIALQFLAETMEIGMEDVMTLGDNFNDASMLQMAGRSVAMGNAEKEIKDMCSHITKTNDEDGVAAAIDEMLSSIPQESSD
ncbi:Cof-type HAD-IIB family hydrolase [Virgibacillus xinjiangensis]|uniref:Cof-type HAD-IIB family hydrolase n=1 Tax=Virgibacillus xinjiangensis TaxID=393090 RepID=A0ABV7CYD8_9BACI